jgi:hypothetical protein
MVPVKNILFMFSVLILVIFAGCNSNGSSYTPASTPEKMPSTKPGKTNEQSQIDLITEPVVKADSIVIGTVVSKTYTRGNSAENEEISLIYSLVTISIEKVIKGETNAKDLLLKVLEEGQVGDSQTGTSYQLINALEGSLFHYVISNKMLVCVAKSTGHNYYTVPRYGVIYINENPSQDITSVTRRVTQIMMKNNIPVALPNDE